LRSREKGEKENGMRMVEGENFGYRPANLFKDERVFFVVLQAIRCQLHQWYPGPEVNPKN